MATAPTLTASDLAAATPVTRDRYVDFLRAASLAIVVLGHWLMAAVEFRQGRFGGTNVLELRPWTQWLTWIFQVMPVFFLVGGFSNAASWTAAQRDGRTYRQWMASRLSRLLRPTAVFLSVWAGGYLALRAAGVGGSTLTTVLHLVVLPLWFLAVYLLIVAAAPAMLVAHRRFGVRMLVGLALGAATVDVAINTFHAPLIGWTNFLFVWAFAHQLGFFWRDGTLGRAKAWAMAIGGLAALYALTHAFGYALSMVGGGGRRSNNSPPSLAIVALTVWQTGAVLLLARRVRSGLARPKVWRSVVAANGVAMSLYLWHLTALVIVAVVALPLGLFPQPELASGSWWLLRPAWIALLAMIAGPIVVFMSRFERPKAKTH